MGLVGPVLWVLGAVLLSSVLSQLIPRVPASLIQIVLGVFLVLIPQAHYTLPFDSDFFLLFFIAPLLYWDAIEADKRALWEQRRPVLAYAFGLVIIIVFVIGFFVHWLVPSIPLAAAFALGAALGPTDAVAVTTLARTVDIPPKQKALLQGELLLNDASGVVSFQFAAAALVTGLFSFVDAGVTLVVSFVGGIGLGAVLALVKLLVVREVRNLGVEDVTFHVLLQLLTPFVAYLLAEHVGVSGILAVVAAGIVESLFERTMLPSNARLKIVSSSVWRVVSFTLNGIVFVLLGTLLPLATRRTLASDLPNELLVVYVLAIAAVLVLTRFAWCLAHVRIARHDDGTRHELDREGVRAASLLTLAGAKGAVTLSICLSIPTIVASGASLASRELIIFLGAGVILVTLLLANYVIPLIMPKKEVRHTAADEAQARIQILRNVITELGHDEELTDKRAVRRVIAGYDARIERIKRTTSTEDASVTSLRERAIGWEAIEVNQQIKDGGVVPIVGYGYLIELERRLSRLRHRRELPWFLRNASGWLGSMRRAGLTGWGVSAQVREQRREARMRLRAACARRVLNELGQLVPGEEYPVENIMRLTFEYQRVAASAYLDRSRTAPAAKDASVEVVRRVALQIERDEITKAYDAGTISRETMRALRDNVAALEFEGLA